MREAFAYVLGAGLSLALLWHFSCIVRFGTVVISEPSAVRLWLEISLLIGVLVYGVVNFIRVLRGK